MPHSMLYRRQFSLKKKKKKFSRTIQHIWELAEQSPQPRRRSLHHTQNFTKNGGANSIADPLQHFCLYQAAGVQVHH
jgi:hypothetical protein